MKRDDFQNAQDRKDSAENKDENPNQQNNQTSRVSKDYNANIHQAGLGRDRMMNNEDPERFNDYSENDDLRNDELNASNDQ